MSKMTSLDYNYHASSSIGDFTSSSTAEETPVIVSDTAFFFETSKAKYSVFEIANWFLSKESMTHKKLQKLCYYAQAWFYALKDFKLVDTEFEAWVHGPVSPILYERFKEFGYSTIKLCEVPAFAIEETDLELLESVWKTYGDHTGNALEALCHSELPWQEARQGYDENERCSIPINPDTMKRYYRSIYIGGDA